MLTPADECLRKTMQLADRMLRLANNGDAVRNDSTCGVVFGVLRDAAYKIKQLAEAERQAHLLQESGAAQGGACGPGVFPCRVKDRGAGRPEGGRNGL